MIRFSFPSVGSLDFPNAPDGYWEFPLKFADRDVRLDVNVRDGQISVAMFEKVKPFVVDIARFDSAARSAIRVDFGEDSEGSSSLYLSHHAEEFSDEERAQHFGSRDVNSLGVEELLKAIHLKRIGLYPESDGYVAVFDYTIGEGATHYVLAIEFGATG
ncbi:DUF2004 domain-containing protein, partial [Ideonella sp.]|uniref:DUF2004 domain-containing protein n=1 Tax=Ideonella sp. TaxID=1929293 RepID=UPI0037BE3DC6